MNQETQGKVMRALLRLEKHFFIDIDSVGGVIFKLRREEDGTRTIQSAKITMLSGNEFELPKAAATKLLVAVRANQHLFEELLPQQFVRTDRIVGVMFTNEAASRAWNMTDVLAVEFAEGGKLKLTAEGHPLCGPFHNLDAFMMRVSALSRDHFGTLSEQALSKAGDQVIAAMDAIIEEKKE